ncbi:MAG: relaxase/mobilization nuclease domain-containing protein [Clostridiaceae bacterium]|nr:relaxase/mobilization nuclease domain-containing protein [Clostridiaceae bacterium]
MAVTKILARKGRLDVGIRYVLNGDKTDEQILTASQGCSAEYAARRMLKTKQQYRQTNGVQYYHLIQSFKPGEITPELALEIAKEFAEEHLAGYQAVIGVHVDKEHIHAHTIFNSVNADTGEKYHSNARSYYQQIRAISDRLCREHGLSVIMEGKADKAVSYIEWLRQRSGQPTFRAMLEADLREAIEDANDMGHFFLIMEHKGYEIKHGARLGFRLRGQERFMILGRKNKLFTEDGIRNAIVGNLDAIEAGTRPAIIYRPQYQPYRRHPKYTGFMALYAHYLYLLGKTGQRQYPPKMTPHLRKEIMKFENYKEQFAFLREHGVTTAAGLDAVRARTEETLASLIKQRTILNVRKKKRKPLFDALADANALAPAKQLYEDGISGMEEQFAQYMDAVAALERCGIPREHLAEEKAVLYQQLMEINREIRLARQKISMCKTIERNRPQMERDIQVAESMAKEVERDEYRRR